MATAILKTPFLLALSISQNMADTSLKVLVQITWAVVILLLTRLAINITGNLARKALKHAEPTLQKFLIQTTEILTLIVGGVAALNSVGIQATTVVAVVGAAGLAIGLALQNTLSHFAAGVMLISLRPFEVGDFIEGAGVAGTVEAIGIFSTTLITPDNIRITVPNGNLFTNTLKNTTALGTRRIDLEVDIGDRPIDLSITHLLALVQPHPLVLNDPKPTCHVASISATTTVLYLRPWCGAVAYERTKSEIQQIVKEALKEEWN